ncbi:hypothetical protein D1815_22785 [Aquimarina sp. AD1]|nr:hypothetical protein D1815_22785 [Aquimarina sp. AD1]RKN16808.1 hypothetical protein D7035_15370 [Aquimarina sp. AD1]
MSLCGFKNNAILTITFLFILWKILSAVKLLKNDVYKKVFVYTMQKDLIIVLYFLYFLYLVVNTGYPNLNSNS